MYCHCGTNNRASRWTFMDPCKPEVRPAQQQFLHKNQINVDIVLDSKAYTLTTGVLAFIFIFKKSYFLWPPSHKWHHK